jgi:hypothetical protein
MTTADSHLDNVPPLPGGHLEPATPFGANRRETMLASADPRPFTRNDLRTNRRWSISGWAVGTTNSDQAGAGRDGDGAGRATAPIVPGQVRHSEAGLTESAFTSTSHQMAARINTSIGPRSCAGQRAD